MDKAKLLNQFSQLLDEIELKEKTAFMNFQIGGLLKELSRNVIEQTIGEADEIIVKKKHNRLITENLNGQLTSICKRGQRSKTESDAEISQHIMKSEKVN